MFYIYDNETNEYTHSAQGQESPLEAGVFFQPPFSTSVAPPVEIPVTQKAVWNTVVWNLVDDNRDEDYWYKATALKVVFVLGDSIAETMTNLPPQEGEEWNGTAWETPILDAKDAKYTEIYAYADTLIEINEATFFTQGGSTSRNKDRLTRKQNKRNNKKIKGQPLTPKEKDADDRYDSFMDWADLVYDEEDLAKDAVELVEAVDDVQAYDVVNTPNWPIWSPPL